MTDRRDRARFFKLLERHCQLGLQLPQEDDFDPDDDAEIARVKLILDEMTAVQSEIDAMMNRH